MAMAMTTVKQRRDAQGFLREEEVDLDRVSTY